MIDLQSSTKPPFSCQRDVSPFDVDQQSLCAAILDAVASEIDIVVNLLSEGDKLLEITDDEMNMKEIKTIIKNLNVQLFQHAVRMKAFNA